MHEGNIIRRVTELYNEIEKSSPAKENNRSQKKSKPTHSRRGGVESFSFNGHCAEHVSRFESRRCYRILSFKKCPDGTHLLVDILNNSVYNNSSHNRITNDAFVYETIQGALGERIPPMGPHTNGNEALPRVLVSFECWGRCVRRKGGGLSNKYEFVRFMGIEKCLGPFSTHAKKHVAAPVPPHFFPRRDLKSSGHE
mmetsp:Transcript_16650/g.25056  ORF Transcript_16650/g.25056 Transcript_16650/m.25056 type:complete len:197 (-) Transcript_16650:209-799(-)